MATNFTEAYTADKADEIERRKTDKSLLVAARKFILEELEKSKFDTDEEMKNFIIEEARKILTTSQIKGSAKQRELVFKLVKDEIWGFGPISDLLKDPEVSEIMVNGPDEIFIERGGKISKVEDLFFTDNEHVKRTIERIVNPLGRSIDASNPMVDARMPDGSRVNAVIPPLSLVGPTITIRKFMKHKLVAQDLINYGSITENMMKYLKACVEAKQNIFVSGGTGSGKTTFLNLLSSYIGADERIITIEDAAELKLQQEHVVSLETKPPGIEGSKGYSIRDLVKNSLRMRPDRIVVGEVRGEEALDMLQAMNTGHDGSLTTGHANSAFDMLYRLETMVLMAGAELPLKAIRQQIVRALDVIVQIARLPDGSRKVIEIVEILDLDKNGEYKTKNIFEFTKIGMEDGKITGKFSATGYVPSNFDALESNGIQLDKSVFNKD